MFYPSYFYPDQQQNTNDGIAAEGLVDIANGAREWTSVTEDETEESVADGPIQIGEIIDDCVGESDDIADDGLTDTGEIC